MKNYNKKKDRKAYFEKLVMIINDANVFAMGDLEKLGKKTNLFILRVRINKTFIFQAQFDLPGV